MRGAQNKPEQEEFVQHLAQWQNVVTMRVVPNIQEGRSVKALSNDVCHQNPEDSAEQLKSVEEEGYEAMAIGG